MERTQSDLIHIHSPTFTHSPAHAHKSSRWTFVAFPAHSCPWFPATLRLNKCVLENAGLAVHAYVLGPLVSWTGNPEFRSVLPEPPVSPRLKQIGTHYRSRFLGALFGRGDVNSVWLVRVLQTSWNTACNLN